MTDLVITWSWDAYHLGAIIFILAVAGAVVWIIYDSITHNKKKVNGKR